MTSRERQQRLAVVTFLQRTFILLKDDVLAPMGESAICDGAPTESILFWTARGSFHWSIYDPSDKCVLWLPCCPHALPRKRISRDMKGVVVRRDHGDPHEDLQQSAGRS